MKHYALLLALLIVACTVPVQEEQPVISDRQEQQGDADALLTAQCDLPVDPQVMLDAFPSSFGSYAEVGETIAERSELPTPDGVTKQSIALRTLTVNDETYISFSGTDACGFNTNLAQMEMMSEFENEDGAVRKVTVDGRDAWISHDARSDLYDVYVLIGERILVQTNGDTSAELTIEAAESIDYDSIEAAME